MINTDGLWNRWLLTSDRRADLDCRENLRKIYTAIKSYHDDFSCYPENLTRLVTSKFLAQKKIKCPLYNRRKILTLTLPDDKKEKEDYLYFYPHHKVAENIIAENVEVLCLDKKNSHARRDVPQNVNVLYTNGDVFSYKENDPHLNTIYKSSGLINH